MKAEKAAGSIFPVAFGYECAVHEKLNYVLIGPDL